MRPGSTLRTTASLLALILLFFSGTAAAEDPRPNILFIIADDTFVLIMPCDSTIEHVFDISWESEMAELTEQTRPASTGVDVKDPLCFRV